MTQFSAQTHKAVTKPQKRAAGHVSRSGCRGSTLETALDGFTTEENVSVDPCPTLRRSLDRDLPTPEEGIVPEALMQKEVSTSAPLTFFPFNKKTVC